MFSAHSLMEDLTNGTERNTTDPQDWTQVYEAVRWIQLLMALLSIVGSGSIIISVMLQRLRRKPELQPLFLLSVSDLLLALCWLIGAFLFSKRCSRLNRHCFHLHTVEQVLYMTSFFYTLNFVWNLYTGIREKLYSCLSGYSVQFSNRVSTANKITALLSGIIPVLLMMPACIKENLSQCHANLSQPYRCLLMHTGALYYNSEEQQPIRVCREFHIYRVAIFLATFFITLLGIIVLMVKTRHIHRRVVTSNGYLGTQQRASFRVIDGRMILYPLIFFFCWGPAVSLAFLQVVKPLAGLGEAGVILYILQALTSASQGFLNSLVYGWTRVNLCRTRRRVLSRDVDTQTPLLRAQKKKRGYQTLRTIG
ncbi:transmembrane protein 116 [Cheilinus undulatus]|uniref:transmembrane protein 116 n=1 Tax=Cheilinus undulatus TaxID=241271 RepID=UPI001BD558FD|nr:transmembrane protein 116 [Cheilinus undulatus]